MNELSVDVVEEIEFLIKWLGLIFFIYVIYVRCIKIFNMNNLVIGFEWLWERLDDWYGCLELIEEVLKWKLDCFLKLFNKDYKKFYEFIDIFVEI